VISGKDAEDAKTIKALGDLAEVVFEFPAARECLRVVSREKGRGQGSLPTAYRDCGGMGAYWRTGPPQPVLREPGRWRLVRQGPVRASGCLRMHVSARRFKCKGSSWPMEWVRPDL